MFFASDAAVRDAPLELTVGKWEAFLTIEPHRSLIYDSSHSCALSSAVRFSLRTFLQLPLVDMVPRSAMSPAMQADAVSGDRGPPPPKPIARAPFPRLLIPAVFEWVTAAGPVPASRDDGKVAQRQREGGIGPAAGRGIRGTLPARVRPASGCLGATAEAAAPKGDTDRRLDAGRDPHRSGRLDAAEMTPRLLPSPEAGSPRFLSAPCDGDLSGTEHR